MPNLAQRLQIAAKSVVGIFNDQSLVQAHGLLSGVLPGSVGNPPVRGTAEYLRAYSQQPWLRAVANRIASSVARVEWQLYAVKPKGQRRAVSAKHIQFADAVRRRALLKAAETDGDLLQITDHPLLDVLHNANDFQTGYGMKKVTQLHIDLVGDAFWLKERDAGGMVVGVWPIPPHWIMSTPTPTFRFFRVSFRAWRGAIPDTEWVWFSDTDPLNPYGRGTGAAMALGDELETDEYAARHTKAFFYNQGRPDLIIWPKDGNTASEPAIRRLEEEWQSRTQGFWRMFKPFFMTREVGIEKLDQNFRAQQFVQLREFERNVVMQHFGIPPEVMGVLEHSNRSTIDAADYLMGRYVLDPRLEFLRTIMQERFVPEFDERLVLDFVSPGVDDRQAQLEAAKAAPFALTLDEWRGMAGGKPMEDPKAGALHYLPNIATMVSMEAIAAGDGLPAAPAAPVAPAPPAGPPAPAGGAPAGPIEPVATDPGEGRRALKVFRAEMRGFIPAAADAGDVVLAEAFAKYLGDDLSALPAPTLAAAHLEPTVARTLVRVWRNHQKHVDRHALVAGCRSGNAAHIAAALDAVGLGAAQTAALRPVLVKAVLRGAEVGMSPLRGRGISLRAEHGQARARDRQKAGLTIDFAGVNARATEWAEAHAAELVDAPAAVLAQIRALVARANADGIPPDTLADMLTELVGLTERQWTAVANFRRRLDADGVAAADVDRRVERYAAAQQQARALAIARTETIDALNSGQQALWDEAVQQGVIAAADFQKVWIATQDADICDDCEALDGETADLDEAFSTGDDGPPAHTNCRCAMGLQDRDAGDKALSLPHRVLSTVRALVSAKP